MFNYGIECGALSTFKPNFKLNLQLFIVFSTQEWLVALSYMKLNTSSLANIGRKSIE